jgi:hypothetical protein
MLGTQRVRKGKSKATLMTEKRIGEILVELHVLTPDEVERVLHAMCQRRYQAKFGQVAKEMNLLREEHILAALAVQMGLFPRVAEMSLQRILGKLSNPVITPVQLPIRTVRQRLLGRWRG